MSSSPFPPQQGFVWRGDWKQRLRTHLSARGFSSVRELATSAPRRSFAELADDLGSGDVAAVQLEWSYLDEAKLGGAVEHCARDFLVRQLCEHLPNGWATSRADEAVVMPRVRAISSWSSSISSH